MNYQMLKALIDLLIKNFKCPNCQSQINEDSLEIIWAAWTSVNLDINCPMCKKHTFIKAEVSQINLWNVIDLKKENIDEFKQKLQQELLNINIKNWNINLTEFLSKESNIKINDEEILKLKDKLDNQHIKAKDLFDNK